LNVRDILDKGTTSKNRSVFEKQRLYSFVRQVLINFIQPNVETEPLFQEFVKQLADERLHLKTYGPGNVILSEGEKMDSVYVVLEGHCLNYEGRECDRDSNSSVYVL